MNSFEKIVIYFNFTEGAYSDYTQFRLLQNAINNNPQTPLWTKNDSFYVDFIKATKASVLKMVLSPLTESLQEVFLDPYLETIVSDIVAKAGGDVFAQVLISSFVEGGRETLSGSMSQFIFGRSSNNPMINTHHQFQEKHATSEIATRNAIENQESFIQVKPRWSSIIKTGASLLLATALVGLGGPMFFGASLVAGVSAIKSFSKSFTIQKTIIHNIVSQNLPSDYYQTSDSNGFEFSLSDDELDTLMMSTFESKFEGTSLRAMVQAGGGGGNPNVDRAKRRTNQQTEIKQAALELVDIYKYIDKWELDPNARKELKQDYLKGIADLTPSYINEQTLRSEVAKSFAEVGVVSKMSYFEFWDYYTQDYGNEYSKRMKRLDKTNIDIRSLTSIRSGEKNKVPDLQTKLLQKYMRGTQKAIDPKSTPYLIYALVNKNKLRDDGEGFLVRVGYSQNIINRQKGYIKDAKAGKWGPLYRDIESQGIDDFEFVFVDIQYGKEAAQISEEFFTIYFNRDPLAGKTKWSPKGVDLFRNQRYNPVIGDIYGKFGEAHPLYKEIYYYQVKELIEQGYEAADIAIKLGVSGKTLFNRIKSWGEPTSNFNYENWAKELRASKLREYYEQGLHVDEIAKKFEKFNLADKNDIVDHVKEKMSKLDVGSIPIISYSEKVIYDWTQKYLGVSGGTAYEIYYVKPIVLALAKMGLSQSEALKVLDNMGVTSRRGTPYDRDSLTRMLKDRLWGPGEGLTWGGRGHEGDSFRDTMLEPIIENLIRHVDASGKRLSAKKIGEILDLGESFIKSYINRRWGFTKITQARVFFDTHYIGYHKYDFYSFK